MILQKENNLLCMEYNFVPENNYLRLRVTETIKEWFLWVFLNELDSKGQILGGVKDKTISTSFENEGK